MNFKKTAAVLSVLLMYSQAFFSQESNIAGEYIEIRGEGLLSNTFQESKITKTLTLSTLGGFVAIHSMDRHTLPGLLYKTYYRLRATSGQEKLTTFTRGMDNQFYLGVGQVFVIDVIDKKTAKLLQKYEVYRIKKVPTLRLAFDKQPAVNSKKNIAIDTGGKLNLSPDESIRFYTTGTENRAVNYTLTNLKTRKALQITSDKGFSPERLASNTNYVLRYHYVVQPESVGAFYISVTPYWYQSTSTYVIIGAVIVFLIFVIVIGFFRYSIQLSEKKQHKIEQAALRLQSLLNPHFTFNALSTIQGLMNTDRIEEANYYLQEFSSLLRKTLATSQQVFNSLDQEMEMMQQYIRLEALRFNFSWEIQIAPEIDASSIEIPTLLLQPLIENSIKHGLSGLGENGKLSISCSIGNESGELEIIVKDNGSWKDTSELSGYGLSLTADRIATINSLSKEQSIALAFNKQAIGTEAILTFYNYINNQ